jgi:site-specific DNA recombinase
LWVVLDTLEEYGIDFVSMVDNLDSKSAAGRFYLNLLGSLAQLESETNSERTKGAMGYNAQEGKSNGSSPSGYRRNEEGILQVHKEEAELVQLIFSKCKELGSGG